MKINAGPKWLQRGLILLLTALAGSVWAQDSTSTPSWQVGLNLSKIILQQQPHLLFEWPLNKQHGLELQLGTHAATTGSAQAYQYAHQSFLASLRHQFYLGKPVTGQAQFSLKHGPSWATGQLGYRLTGWITTVEDGLTFYRFGTENRDAPRSLLAYDLLAGGNWHLDKVNLEIMGGLSYQAQIKTTGELPVQRGSYDYQTDFWLYEGVRPVVELTVSYRH
ncbi:MAG: hypothetical protein RI842_09845 [Schleiferiaceae bacterium]|jgi:hypothetical protein|nr:hypothetical protein [Schleiferiaceae bacterium]MDR9443010.1 hypothetical protein [Schleiferiaceae bacterium]